MPSELPFDKIIQAAQRHGAEFVEIFTEKTRQTAVICDDNRLEQAASFCDEGVGIRVLVGNKTAYGSTNDLARRSLLDLAKKISSVAQAKRTKAGPVILAETKSPRVSTVLNHPFGIPLNEKCSVVLRANDVAWKAGQKIRQVRIQYRDTIRRVGVATSDGGFANDEQVDTVFIVHVVAADGSVLQTGYEPIGGNIGFEIFDATPPEEVAAKAASRAIELLTARPAPAGTMPVIIAAEAGGTMIHEAVGHGLEADIACEGLSVYSGKIGERVASELVSVADDSTLKNRRGSFTFDDEGTLARRTLLIEHGILKGYMSDRATMRRYDVPLTGNGRRQSYAHPPIVRMTNTLILPGKDDPATILKDTPCGLFVRKMGGGQVNTVNGDFVFEVQEGYLIKGGKIGELVRGATLIGNGPRVLMTIDRVGKDLGFSIGTCGKDGQEVPVSCGQPTLRIPEIVVGGTAG